MTTAGIILFALGAFLTLSNVYFSFVRYPIHLARGGTRETYRWVSGIPLFGSLLLWISIGLLPSTGFKWLAGILDLRHRGDSLVHWYDVVDRTVGRSFSRPQRLGIVPAGVNAMTKTTSMKRIRELGDSKTASKIRFSAPLLRPKATTTGGAKAVEGAGGWTFLTLPKQASARLPSRGQTTVEGAINGAAFQATLEPDGRGGHWLKVDRKLRESAGAEVGDIIALEITPLGPGQEPEPEMPPDLRKALAAAPAKAREAWSDITPAARRDFIHWIVSPKRSETRVKRITTACDMLAKGKRRPCCFDRSGMYAKSMSCPVADA